MVTATVAPAPAPQGHCSQCGKIWALNKAQGVCPWCGKLSTCQRQRVTTLRNTKSRSNRRKTQAPTNGNGYRQLEGDWLTYYQVALRFTHKVKPEDREDLLHDIMIALADVERNKGHKPFTEAVMYRIASVAVNHYWYRHYKVNNGLDCQHCSKAQRAKCKEGDLYRECPKAIKLESLNKPVIDSEGNTTELGEMIADDKAIDLDAWVDARMFLLGFPKRLMDIAHKINNVESLTWSDYKYLQRYRKREQMKLC
jgi:hypothetical protein